MAGDKLRNYACACLAAGLIPLLGSGATTPPALALAPVGPPLEAKATAPATSGSLKVFSARQRCGEGDIIFKTLAQDIRNIPVHFLAHSDYTLCQMDGEVLRNVRNARGLNDPDPALVMLPAGQYHIKAKAEGYDEVTVPVVIEPGQTTTVILEGNWQPVRPHWNESDLVRMPNGRIVGWRARAMAKSNGP